MAESATTTNLIFSFLVLFASLTYTSAIDTISANQTIRYGDTIVSTQETFELGFFKAGNSTNYYIGIWYKKFSTGTVVWVANRNTPLTNSSGDLTLTLQGVLVLRNATGNIIWSSSKSSKQPVRNPVGRLLDSGNFIIQEDDDTDSKNPIWQSFDFPTDNFLAGMKFGWDLVAGMERNITSWKSADDPAVGEFTAFLDTRGYPQMIITEGSKKVFRSSPWNGLRYSGGPNMGYNFRFVLNQTEIYYQYNLINNSVFSRVKLRPNGDMDRLLWVDSKKEWNLYLSLRTDNCDRFAICGPFASCNINDSPTCGCLKGFEPTSSDQWKVGNWDQGCRQRTPLDCGPGEGFNRFSNLKIPDTQRSRFNQTWTLEECERVCKSNCSCTAYTHSDISGSESGCLLWFGDLIDIRTVPEIGKDIFIRLPPSELDTSHTTKNNKMSNGRGQVRIIVPVASASLILVILVCIFLFYRYKKQRQRRWKEGTLHNVHLDLPPVTFCTLLKATNNFSVNNKLGEGGYGPVYKGVLEDGQEIAVKRLAQTSAQGLDEFKNEVISISKLQHRNLVKLLGCCVEKAEKLLIYEYLPNKGLDSFIFDKLKSKFLDWDARFKIINGIARGLLYLHQDSRHKIIHRDLKVSNILLDLEMNPKISDFGMARSFGGNQIEANTTRVVGTYGYMAPEYAGHGIFSTKSDVFSFGVMVLEIVSEEKNRGFFHEERKNSLIGHAWELHKEGKALQLVAKNLVESINVSQVLRSIHVGLLCVQRRPEDRPTMTTVVSMLGSESPMPSPEEPGFFIGKNKEVSRYSSGKYDTRSTNDLTVTILNGRS